MTGKAIALIALGGVLVAGVLGAQLMRKQYDEPPYRLLVGSDNFEIRSYEGRIVAETTVVGQNLQESASAGFGRLAGYIFGDNKTSGGEPIKIAMTTPVESAPAEAGRFVVVFTMPPQYRLEDLPRPNDARVVVRKVPAATVAALRFSGVARAQDLDALAERLLEQVESQGYRAASPVKLAQYDPPWVVGPLRRNEIMVDVEPAAG